MRYGYRMPLKFRETGLALSPHEIRKDCTAFSGEWAVGYIYREAPERFSLRRFASGAWRWLAPFTLFWLLEGIATTLTWILAVVVISIIAILISISLPAFSKVRAAAKGEFAAIR